MRLKLSSTQIARAAFIGFIIAVLLVQNLHGAVIHDTGGARLVGFGLPLRFAIRDALGFQRHQWLWSRPELIEDFRAGALAIDLFVSYLIVHAMLWRCIQIERSQWQISMAELLMRMLVAAVSLRLVFLIHMHNLHLFSDGATGSLTSFFVNFVYVWAAIESLIVAITWTLGFFWGLAAKSFRRRFAVQRIAPPAESADEDRPRGTKMSPH